MKILQCLFANNENIAISSCITGNYCNYWGKTRKLFYIYVVVGRIERYLCCCFYVVSLHISKTMSRERINQRAARHLVKCLCLCMLSLSLSLSLYVVFVVVFVYCSWTCISDNVLRKNWPRDGQTSGEMSASFSPLDRDRETTCNGCMCHIPLFLNTFRRATRCM